jgi:hypothetical protein
MWDKLKKYLGYVWASPVTLFGLTYVGIYTAAGWYKWHGMIDDALVWTVNNEKLPPWLAGYWSRLGGQASGQVVVLKNHPGIKPVTLKHELKHVDQTMRLGIFWPIFYYGSMLAIKWGCPGSDSYYDNPFEIDARRHAGQIVDIVGMKNRIIESKKS